MEQEIFNYIETLSNNDKIQKLLIETIGKILLKQTNLELFIHENDSKIIHIRDWIISIVKTNEQWKTPRVLTLEALNNAADKYFEKKNNKIQTIELNETHEKLIADLGDYYIVQMLTPEALDNESKIMQHCIGHGGYDNRLKTENFQYLSLRDKFNKAHITIETRNKKILQLQGKQNEIPDKKYLFLITEWLMENKYKNIPWEKIGSYLENGKWIKIEDIKLIENIDLIKYYDNNQIELLHILTEKADFFYDKIYNYDKNKIYFFINNNKEIYLEHPLAQTTDLSSNTINNIIKGFQDIFDLGYQKIPYENYECILNIRDNKIYSIYQMPNNCETNTSVALSKYDIEKLPNNLTINGNLSISSCYLLEKLPENLIVNGYLFIENSDIKIIPNNIKINGDLILTSTEIKKLPNNLEIIGNLSLYESKIKKIPENMKIGKSILLSESEIEFLKDNLIVNGDLDLSYCKKIKNLPKGLVVNGDLNLQLTNLKMLPNDIKVKGAINIQNSKIEELPDDLTCENIIIDRHKINLIKETMNFKHIFVEYLQISKDKFFEKNDEISKYNINDFRDFKRFNKLS